MGQQNQQEDHGGDLQRKPAHRDKNGDEITIQQKIDKQLPEDRQGEQPKDAKILENHLPRDQLYEEGQARQNTLQGDRSAADGDEEEGKRKVKE